MKKLSFCIVFVIFLVSCREDFPPRIYEYDFDVTCEIIEVTTTTATLEVQIYCKKNVTILDVRLELDDEYYAPHSSQGTKYRFEIKELEENEYYSLGSLVIYSYGNSNIELYAYQYGGGSFKTVRRKDQIQAVDLGLSVKWASCNVGAIDNHPDEYGDYFAWGEVRPKSYYDWSTYKYCKGDYDLLTKYCTKSSYGYNGFTDYKVVLDLTDDAAHVNWGGSWRMPTQEEQDELIEQCEKHYETSLNGVRGWIIVGTNGNSIFLPYSGYMDESTLRAKGNQAYFWASSLPSNPSSGYNFWIENEGDTDSIHWNFQYSRKYGFSVRPVHPY